MNAWKCKCLFHNVYDFFFLFQETTVHKRLAQNSLPKNGKEVIELVESLSGVSLVRELDFKD